MGHILFKRQLFKTGKKIIPPRMRHRRPYQRRIAFNRPGQRQRTTKFQPRGQFRHPPAAAFRIDQNQRSAEVVVQIRRMSADSPKVSERKISLPREPRERTCRAGLPQAKVGKKRPHELILPAIGRINVFFRFDGQKIRIPAPHLVAKIHRQHFFFPFFRQFFRIAAEGQRRRHTVTNHVNRQQIVIFSAEKGVETGNLTGRSGKQDLPSRLQQFFRLPVTVSGFALHVFGTFQLPQTVQVVDADMPDRSVFVPGRAENRTAFLQNPFGQQRKNGSGRAVAPEFVSRRRGQTFRLFRIFADRMFSRTNPRAQTAADALIDVDHGPYKSFLADFHPDCPLRTAGGAGSAAGTGLRIVYAISHELLRVCV